MPMRLFCAITASSASHHISPSRSGKLVGIYSANGSLVFPQQRIGPLIDVLVAVVEGDADEAALEILADEAPVHLVERDDVDAGARQPPQQPFEEFGVTSSSRLGWKASGRGGRTWCIVRIAPTPPTSGRMK